MGRPDTTTVSGLVLLALLEVQAKAQRNQEGNAGNLLEPRWDGGASGRMDTLSQKPRGPQKDRRGRSSGKLGSTVAEPT